MIRRFLAPVVHLRLAESPAVVLTGARQVGKTTLAFTLGESSEGGFSYLDLESVADRRRLEEPAAYFASRGDELIVLDEVHRLPTLFDELRGVIDVRRRAGHRTGQFLLLGSASLDLVRSSETLAGRVAYLELPGVCADEAAAAGLDSHEAWIRGGFPESLLAPTAAASYRWRRDLIRSYLERDVARFAPNWSTLTIRRLWQMLAADSGQVLNAAKLAAALEVSGPTVTRYVELLSDLLLVRTLPPWTANIRKRVTRKPKVYVRDSGLIHALLELPDLDAVLGHSVAGMSWESYAVETLTAASASAGHHFYRTGHGAEIDLLLTRSGEPHTAIEVKRSATAKISAGFHQACADLAVPHRFVVGAEPEPGFPRSGGVTAIGLAELATRLRESDDLA